MTELRTIEAPPEAKGQRLDQFLVSQLEGVSASTSPANRTPSRSKPPPKRFRWT
jgi:hypothetical protein